MKPSRTCCHTQRGSGAGAPSIRRSSGSSGGGGFVSLLRYSPPLQTASTGSGRGPPAAYRSPSLITCSPALGLAGSPKPCGQ